MSDDFTTLLRKEMDKILEIIEADPEQPYYGLADRVRAWGTRKQCDGMIEARREKI